MYIYYTFGWLWTVIDIPRKDDNDAVSVPFYFNNHQRKSKQTKYLQNKI